MTDWGPLSLAAAALPLLAAAVLPLAGRRCWWLTVVTLAVTAALTVTTLVLFAQHAQASKAQLQPTVPPWTHSIAWLKLSQLGVEGHGVLGFSPDAPTVELHLGYHIDGLAAVFSAVVSVIALSLMLAASSHDRRVCLHALLLTSAVLNVLIAENLLQLFLVWVLTGLVVSAPGRGYLMQRLGEVGLLVGLLILATGTGTLGMVTVREPERDATGQVVFEDGQAKMRLSRLSVADALRTPEKDSHDDRFAEPGAVAGQLCRVNPTRTARGKKKLELADDGALVVVWNQETLNGHYDRPDRRRFDAFAPDAAGGHGKGLRTVPYWMLCVAGLGLVLGCVSKLCGMSQSRAVTMIVPVTTVYLAARGVPFLTPPILLTLGYVGVVAAVYQALRAWRAADAEHRVAFLYRSQLGIALAALALGGWTAALVQVCLAAAVAGAGWICVETRSHPMSRLLLLLCGLLLLILPMVLVGQGQLRPGSLAILWSFAGLDLYHPLLIVLLGLSALAISSAVVARHLWPTDLGGKGTAATSARILPAIWLLVLPVCFSSLESLLATSEPPAATEAGALRLNDVAEQVANGFFKSGSSLRALHEATGIGPFGVAVATGLTVILLAALLAWFLPRRQTPSQLMNRDQSTAEAWFGVHPLAASVDALDRRLWRSLVATLASFVLVLARLARFVDDQVLGGVIRALSWPFRRLVPHRPPIS